MVNTSISSTSQSRYWKKITWTVKKWAITYPWIHCVEERYHLGIFSCTERPHIWWWDCVVLDRIHLPQNGEAIEPTAWQKDSQDSLKLLCCFSVIKLVKYSYETQITRRTMWDLVLTSWFHKQGPRKRTVKNSLNVSWIWSNSIILHMKILFPFKLFLLNNIIFWPAKTLLWSLFIAYDIIVICLLSWLTLTYNTI